MSVALAKHGVDDCGWTDEACHRSQVRHGRTDDCPVHRHPDLRTQRLTARPWYPLVGHRQGLRMNDLVTLASALFVLALEDGTAHLSGESQAWVDSPTILGTN